MPEKWTLESFPFKLQTGVNQRQIRTFAEFEFIPKAENIVFIGETGVGKTGLASSLIVKAVQNGYRALFVSAQTLFDTMYTSLADRSTRKLLNTLIKVDLLCVDEFGYHRPIVRARPGPTFGRPVHLRDGSLDYGPVLLLMPFGSHLTVDTLPSGESEPSPASEAVNPAFGYDAPHSSIRGTSTLLNNALWG